VLLEISTHAAPAAAAQESGGAMELYDKLFVAFNDALESIRADLRGLGKEQTAKAELARAELRKLQAALGWQKLQHTVRRTLLLITCFGAEGKAKRTQPDEFVRLYESVLNTLGEMGGVEGHKEDAQLMSHVTAAAARVTAYRCYHVAGWYYDAAKWPEAMGLYARCEALLEEAHAAREVATHGSAVATDPLDDPEALRALEALVDGAKARTRAQAILAQLQGPAEVAGASSQLGDLSVQTDASSSASLSLAERLVRCPKSVECADPEHLVDFPPKFESVPCKPLLFDIARNFISMPDLAERAEQKKGASWSSWGKSALGFGS
jgi:signal recognition particle subunit SRP68